MCILFLADTEDCIGVDIWLIFAFDVDEHKYSRYTCMKI